MVMLSALLLVFALVVANADVIPPKQVNSSVATKLGYAWDNRGNVGAWATGHVSWYYTWNPDRINTDKEFVPMLWGPGQASDFENKHNSGGFNGVTAVLGFNEPDNGGQSNLSPAAAASLWKQYIQPLSGKYKLGAPAVTSAPSGKAWMINFMNACGGCTIDFIPIHWYGSDAGLFQQYVADFYQSFKRPIWVTEWACVVYGGPPCGQQNVYDFMGQTTLWLDQQSYVERFSWFGARVAGIPDTDALLAPDGNSLTALGQQYVDKGGHG